MKALLEEYKLIKYIPSIEEQQELDYHYVYATNKLEGNELTLVQTTELLSSDTISDSRIKISDILEQKGMYKALLTMKKATLDKTPLSINLIKELNGNILSRLWKDDGQYYAEKASGQKLAEFKISQNRIRIRKGNKVVQIINPKSNPDNVASNMNLLLNTINKSNENTISKAVRLSQEIWIRQPFRDGNKRLGRLLINFLTMKDGYPLFVFDANKGTSYNTILISEYLDNKTGLLLKHVKQHLSKAINIAIEQTKNIEPAKQNRDFGMGLMF